MRWLTRWRPSPGTLLVLSLAQAWGQVKLVLTLWLGASSLPPLIQWLIGSGIALLITLLCFHTTNWAVRRWGK